MTDRQFEELRGWFSSALLLLDWIALVGTIATLALVGVCWKGTVVF